MLAEGTVTKVPDSGLAAQVCGGGRDPPDAATQAAGGRGPEAGQEEHSDGEETPAESGHRVPALGAFKRTSCATRVCGRLAEAAPRSHLRVSADPHPRLPVLHGTAQPGRERGTARSEGKATSCAPNGEKGESEREPTRVKYF